MVYGATIVNHVDRVPIRGRRATVAEKLGSYLYGNLYEIHKP
jgi:hypothetical protein